MHLVSFIIITYNRVNELKECLDSIIKQRYSNFEILLIDNNSSDNTKEMIQSEYPQVKLILSKENMGVPEARNIGVKHANGEILIFIDDDAIIQDDSLCERVVNFFYSNKDVGILAFRILNYYSKKIASLEFPHYDLSKQNQAFDTTYFIGAGNAVTKEVINKVGCFYSDYYYSIEELDYSWRTLASGFRIFYSPDFSIYHKSSPVSRPHTRYVYYSIRNRIWFVITFLPLRYIFSHLSIWMTFFLYQSLLIKNPFVYFLGILDAVKKIKKYMNRRQKLKLDKKTIAKIKKLNGRLFY